MTFNNVLYIMAKIIVYRFFFFFLVNKDLVFIFVSGSSLSVAHVDLYMSIIISESRV